MKHLIYLVMILSVLAYGEYEVGDTVASEDNISWTVSGPPDHPEVGNSSNIFDMVDTERKPVMIFFGQSW